MTTIHTEKLSPSEITHALMLYTQGDSSTNLLNVDHATLHLVRDGMVMPSTKPLTTHALQALSDSLQKLTAHANGQAVIQIQPDTVLFRDTANAITVWWRPCSPTPQFFNCEELGQIQGVTPMPSLVFVQCGKSLRMCAVAGTQRPNSDTPVFHAPMFNTYNDGNVCLGGIDLKPIGHISDIEINQDKFLRGVNTHPNGNHRKTLYENGIFALWRDLIADPSKVWKDEWLNPMGNTLGKWLTEVCK